MEPKGGLHAAHPFFLRMRRLGCTAAHLRGGTYVAETGKPLLIKRYASRRLYNTETSDYVTLEDIAGFIRDGREVQIIDLKSGDDLTRQYLLQIIAEHESRGESVLPVEVLNDLVRSYMTGKVSVVPEFLQQSFAMLRDGQSKVIENITTMNPLSKMPGFDAMQTQQKTFMNAMTGSWPAGGAPEAPKPATENSEDLDAIKRQLSELQEKLSKLK
jgi:polyhydroxyalkanoate synthesis repressor PhaR